MFTIVLMLMSMVLDKKMLIVMKGKIRSLPKDCVRRRSSQVLSDEGSVITFIEITFGIEYYMQVCANYIDV